MIYHKWAGTGLFFICVLLALPLYAADIPSSIDTEYHLLKKNSPILINHDIIIQPEGKLIIEPGVAIRFGDQGGIVSYGTLTAIGNAKEHISFIPQNQDKQWKNILLSGDGASSSVLRYCVIRGGGGRQAEFHEKNVQYSNKGKFVGGGLAIINASPAIENSTIEENSAQKGGGVFIFQGSPVLTHNTITKNMAYSGGGGYLSRTDTSHITNNTFKENKGERGGGLFLGLLNKKEFSRNIISGNTAQKGGGVYLYKSETHFFNNKIIENTSNDGGGLFIYGSNAVIEKNSIIKNRSTDDGGGVYNYRSTPRIVRNAITHNTADDGGGIRCPMFSRNPEMEGNRFESNTPEDCDGCKKCM